MSLVPTTGIPMTALQEGALLVEHLERNFSSGDDGTNELDQVINLVNLAADDLSESEFSLLEHDIQDLAQEMHVELAEPPAELEAMQELAIGQPSKKHKKKRHKGFSRIVHKVSHAVRDTGRAARNITGINPIIISALE